MRRIRRAIKFLLPYGIVRAHQVARERDVLRAQLEAERAAARDQAAVREADPQPQREIAAAQEQVAREQAAREEVTRQEKERRLFAENEIVYNGKRVFTVSSVPNITLAIGGSGNSISLNEFSGGGHIHITMQDSVHDCRVSVGEKNRICANLFVHFYSGGGRSPRNSSVEVGSHNIINGTICIISGLQAGTVVSVGNENLFADNINLIGAVDHLTYNVKTKEKYCQEFGVSIKDRVWVCKDALLMNGAVVDSDSIVAARSVVNKAFKEKNVLIAGVPAKIAKTDVMWHLLTTDEYLSDPSPLMVKG